MGPIVLLTANSLFHHNRGFRAAPVEVVHCQKTARPRYARGARRLHGYKVRIDVCYSTSMDYFFLGAAIVCEVFATSALKTVAGFSRLGPSVIVILGYAAAFYCLSLAIRTVPLGVAYAVWSGVGTAILVVVGAVFYKQSVDAATIVGIALILSGVVVLNIFSNAGCGH